MSSPLLGGFSFDALPMPAMLLELDGTILAANRVIAAERDLVGLHVSAIAPGLAVRWSALVDTVVREGKAVDEMTSPGPPPRHYRFMLARVTVDGRQVVQGIAIDITARKVLEDANRERAAAAEQQRLDGLAMVAGGIAHDFNNLLVGVLAEASGAREDAGLPEPAREALRRIEAAARRMAQLTRQLLAYAGRAEIVMVPLDPDALLRELDEPLCRACAGVDLVLAPAATGAVIAADPTLLRQVVTNLVANACDADARRIELASTIVGVRGAPWWELAIADDGRGIDAATLPRIFEPFFSTKRDRHGLGLSAVHGIVRRLDGTIEVATRHGGGARFVVRIPVVAGARPARKLPSDVAGMPALQLARIHALVADDEPSVRASVRRLLERRGAIVTVATDGTDAVARLRAARFDLVIADVTMPGLSGHDVLAAARAAQPGVPVLLMSGYSERARGAGSEEEPDGFVEKPFSAKALDAAIARVLAERSPR